MCAQLIGLLIIGVAAYAKVASYLHNLAVLGGVVATGVLLLFVAVLGLVGTCKKSNPALAIYIFLLALLFLIQVSEGVCV